MNTTELHIKGLKITLASIEEQLTKLRAKIKAQPDNLFLKCMHKECQEWRREVLDELAAELEIQDIIESV